ncbi:hypothetical protein [Streptomyces sp. NPDC050535]|uniref:hypothetical protein n=1 Tax=Streptomyces sp. NPDC050535 TaxID=3365626 RepID=UPI0037A7414A
MSFADLPPGVHAPVMHDHWWWRPGWQAGQRGYAWHLTFSGQAQLHRLTSAYQLTLAPFQTLDMVPIQWLHLTMQGMGFVGATSTDEAAKTTKAARSRLLDLPPLTFGFQEPVVADEAVVLPLDDETGVRAARAAIRSAMGASSERPK